MGRRVNRSVCKYPSDFPKMNMKTKQQMDAEIANVRALLSAGHLDHAQFECTRVVSEFPGQIAPLCLMSYLLYIRANFKNAVRYAHLAQAQITPESDWREIVSVSNALLMVAEEKAALDIMRVRDDYGSLDNFGREVVAKHFGKLDCLEEAAALFEPAALAGEMNYHSWQMYGVTLVYLGRSKEAVTLFEKAIDVNPNDGISYHQLSGLNLKEGREARIRDLELLASKVNLDAINESYAHFSLYNEYEAEHKFETAFAHLKKANDVRRSTVNYDPRQEHDYYLNIIQQFSKLPELPKSDEVDSVNPIFIVGMPRTGTTLLEKIMGGYAAVKACGELRTMRMQIQEPNDIGRITDFSALDYGKIGQEYLRNVLWRTDGSKWFTDKHPSNNVFAGIIARALPNAKIVHITKNPMDACFSNYRQFFTFNSYTYSYTLEDLAAYYRNYQLLMDFWHKHLPEHIIHVRYEDLVLNAGHESERIREFCGFPQHIKENQDFVTNTLSAVQVRKPIHAGNINAWAKYAEQLKPLREALDEEYVAYMRPIEGVQIL
jgi:tetratricopeptide (TPR) repeat protein